MLCIIAIQITDFYWKIQVDLNNEKSIDLNHHNPAYKYYSKPKICLLVQREGILICMFKYRKTDKICSFKNYLNHW